MNADKKELDYKVKEMLSFIRKEYHVPEDITSQIAEWCKDEEFDWGAMKEDLSEPDQSYFKDWVMASLDIDDPNTNIKTKFSRQQIFRIVDSIVNNVKLPAHAIDAQRKVSNPNPNPKQSVARPATANVNAAGAKNKRNDQKDEQKQKQKQAGSHKPYDSDDNIDRLWIEHENTNDYPLIQFLNSAETEVLFHNIKFKHFEDVKGIQYVLKHNVLSKESIEKFYFVKFNTFVRTCEAQTGQEIFNEIRNNLRRTDGKFYEFVRDNPPFDRILNVLEKIIDQLIHPQLKPILLTLKSSKSKASKSKKTKKTSSTNTSSDTKENEYTESKFASLDVKKKYYESNSLFSSMDVDLVALADRKYDLFDRIPLSPKNLQKRCELANFFFHYQCPLYFMPNAKNYLQFIRCCVLVHENEIHFDGNNFDLLIVLTDIYDRFLMIHGYLYCIDRIEHIIHYDNKENERNLIESTCVNKYHTDLLNARPRPRPRARQIISRNKEKDQERNERNEKKGEKEYGLFYISEQAREVALIKQKEQLKPIYKQLYENHGVTLNVLHQIDYWFSVFCKPKLSDDLNQLREYIKKPEMVYLKDEAERKKLFELIQACILGQSTPNQAKHRAGFNPDEFDLCNSYSNVLISKVTETPNTNVNQKTNRKQNKQGDRQTRNLKWLMHGIDFVRTHCLTPPKKFYYYHPELESRKRSQGQNKSKTNTNTNATPQPGDTYYSDANTLSATVQINPKLSVTQECLIQDDFKYYSIYAWSFLHFLMTFMKETRYKLHTYNHNIFDRLPANYIYHLKTGELRPRLEPEKKAFGTKYRARRNKPAQSSTNKRTVMFHNMNFPLHIDLIIIPKDMKDARIPIHFEEHFAEYSGGNIGYCKLPIKYKTIKQIADLMAFCFRQVITNPKNLSYYDRKHVKNYTYDPGQLWHALTQDQLKQVSSDAAKNNQRRRDDRYVIIIDRRRSAQQTCDTICAYPPYFENFDAGEMLQHRRKIKIVPRDKDSNAIEITKESTPGNDDSGTTKPKVHQATIETQDIIRTQNRFSLVSYEYTEITNFYLTHKCVLPNANVTANARGQGSKSKYIGLQDETFRRNVVCLSAHYHKQTEWFSHPLLRVYQYLPCGSMRFFYPDIENLWANVIGRNKEEIVNRNLKMRDVNKNNNSDDEYDDAEEEDEDIKEVRRVLELEKCDAKYIRWRHSFARDYKLKN